MADEFAQSLTLLFSGAGITLLSTVAVDALRGRREKARETERAKALEREKFRELGREHTMQIHAALLELFRYGRDHPGQAYISPGPVADALTLLQDHYVLVPDLAVRACLAHALYLVANTKAQPVTRKDWNEAAGSASFVVAAYLRGDELPPMYVDRLEEMEANYRAAKAAKTN
jgi:hypothetical protein